MTAASRCAALAVLVLAMSGGDAHAQARVQCESRDYRYQFCTLGSQVDAVHLVEQRSRSACIEGRTWGWDRRGVWVDRGCEGVFDVQTYVPAPPPAPLPDRGLMLTCESRDYQYEFCVVRETLLSVQMVGQRSRSACIEGRTWGWRPTGVWVSGGCEADFAYRTAAYVAPIAPPPPSPGLMYCESRDHRYTFCPTGRLHQAELVNLRSEAPCVYGKSWGYQNDGIWVDHGCAAEFAVRPR